MNASWILAQSPEAMRAEQRRRRELLASQWGSPLWPLRRRAKELDGRVRSARRTVSRLHARA